MDNERNPVLMALCVKDAVFPAVITPLLHRYFSRNTQSSPDCDTLTIRSPVKGGVSPPISSNKKRLTYSIIITPLASVTIVNRWVLHRKLTNKQHFYFCALLHTVISACMFYHLRRRWLLWFTTTHKIFNIEFTTTHKKGIKKLMTTLKERYQMIIRALNNPDKPLQPISNEKFEFLKEMIGTDQLALDVNYLIEIGLIKKDAVVFGCEGHCFFSPHLMALTAKGYDYANIDTIGNDLNAVTIKIHKNTLEHIETIINKANLPESEKKTLLKLVKEKGAEAIVGKCVDTLFANASVVTQVLSELAKSAF